ncbi:MAG: M28 family peptidase [Vulcanimicrobiaceae bacterium]
MMRPKVLGMRIARRRCIALLVLAAMGLWSSAPADAALTALERTMLDIPSAAGALADSRVLAKTVHFAGSPGDHAVARWMRDQLSTYGFTARLEPFPAQLSTPTIRSLTLLGPRPIALDVNEAGLKNERLPNAGTAFAAGSGSGTVSAPVVYADRGLTSDYRVLRAAGVVVRGKIVLVRYGSQFRGRLARRAQAHGAAGVLFYTDPADLPAPPGAIQSGYLGRPTLSIPVLPISAAVAQQIMRRLQGAPAPLIWRGALAAPYLLGQTDVPLRLVVSMQRHNVTLWNTVAVIRGRTPESVVLGVRRDAWVSGVTDSGSGISALLEAARALGFLHRSGWVPRRSIIVIGFDGGQLGGLGALTYVRKHQFELRRDCIAYLNADTIVTGERFAVNAANALDDVITSATNAIADPRKATRTLFERWQRQPDGARIYPPLAGPGATDFLDYFGVPIAQAGLYGRFARENSAYDDLTYARNTTDPDFVNHRALAQLLALVTMRLADDAALPYRFAPYAGTYRTALAPYIHALTPRQRRHLGYAIERFEVSADRFDARSHMHTRGLMRVARALDVALYGRSDETTILVPALAAAVRARSQLAIAAAVHNLDLTLNWSAYELY